MDSGAERELNSLRRETIRFPFRINLKDLLFILLRSTLVPFFLREVVQRNKVTIVLYHNLDPSTADRHFRLLKNKYNIISLKDFVNARKSGGIKQLPSKSLIITFDDGRRGNYSLLPIFKKYGITPTIFLCAGIVGTNRHFWFLETQGKLNNEQMKKLSNIERLDKLKQIGFEQERDFDIRHALSQDEVKWMKENVDFQSHTMFHPCLPKCSTEQAHREIRLSRQVLIEKFGLDVFALSYPNGDYSSDAMRQAQEEGYTCGITVDLGYNDQNTDLFRLKRICLRDAGRNSEILVRATGLWDYLKKTLRYRH